jgi:hypothetical protein
MQITSMMLTTLQAMQAAKPGTYDGESCVLKISEPETPPKPPIAVSEAELKALRHCPRILLDWYAITAGIALFVPDTVMNTPTYF